MFNSKQTIGIFEADNQETTMRYGFYYKATFDLPFAEGKRAVRVWLPEDYDFEDPSKRFPVIYFSDGQNLVNKYLTAYGDWGLDKVAHELLQEDGISFIAVGIDCPKEDNERSNELCPPYPVDRDHGIIAPKGDKFVNFIADQLKPLIDGLFFTKPQKPFTAIAGSSMGGIMAFYGGATRFDVFGFSLDFSPAFLLYSQKHWKEILDGLEMTPEKGVKHFFYVGGKDFESYFVSHTFLTFRYMKRRGFTNENLAIIYDSLKIHHESAWHVYLKPALSFWLKNV